MYKTTGIHPLTLVTGATGKTGAAVVQRLLHLGWPVRALVHKTDERSARLQQAGAEVVVADMYDMEQMVRALRGTQRAYFVPLVQPYMIQAANVFAVAAIEAGLEHVVNVSQWIASPQHPSLHTRQLWLVENVFSLLVSKGIGHTVVNPGLFAEPLMTMLPTVAQMGIFPNPFGDHRNCPPCNEDIAKVAVGCLMDPNRHAGKRYRPTGPEMLSIQEMAATMGRVLNRPVKVQNVSAAMFVRAARVTGFPMFEIASTCHYIQESRYTAFEVHGPTQDVLEVSGEAPETFEQTVKRYVQILPGVSNTPQNKLRAIGNAIKMLFQPSFDLKRYEEALLMPQPASGELAGQSQRWLREHQDNLGMAAASPSPATLVTQHR